MATISCACATREGDLKDTARASLGYACVKAMSSRYLPGRGLQKFCGPQCEPSGKVVIIIF